MHYSALFLGTEHTIGRERAQIITIGPQQAQNIQCGCFCFEYYEFDVCLLHISPQLVLVPASCSAPIKWLQFLQNIGTHSLWVCHLFL